MSNQDNNNPNNLDPKTIQALTSYLEAAQKAKEADNLEEEARLAADVASGVSYNSYKSLQFAIEVEIKRRVSLAMQVTEHSHNLENTISSLRGELEETKRHSQGFSFREWAPIFKFMATAQRIQAIKAIRELTGCGIKEAKYLIDGTWTQELFDFEDRDD